MVLSPGRVLDRLAPRLSLVHWLALRPGLRLLLESAPLTPVPAGRLGPDSSRCRLCGFRPCHGAGRVTLGKIHLERGQKQCHFRCCCKFCMVGIFNTEQCLALGVRSSHHSHAETDPVWAVRRIAVMTSGVHTR